MDKKNNLKKIEKKYLQIKFFVLYIKMFKTQEVLF